MPSPPGPTRPPANHNSTIARAIKMESEPCKGHPATTKHGWTPLTAPQNSGRAAGRRREALGARNPVLGSPQSGARRTYLTPGFEGKIILKLVWGRLLCFPGELNTEFQLSPFLRISVYKRDPSVHHCGRAISDKWSNM